MEWTQQDTDALRQFTTTIDSDDIKVKEKIKQVLLDNRFIIKTLNNKELEDVDAEPEEYYGINILPYYMISPTQTNVQNFICYEVAYNELDRYNSAVKKLNIVFTILCNDKTIMDDPDKENNIIDDGTGIPRHDLLAALIQDTFNYTNYFGRKIKLVSDVPSTVDTHYACRVLTFEQITDNNLVKTSGQPRLANKDVIY